MGFFSKVISKIKGISDFSCVDWEELERELLESDLGPNLTREFISKAKKIKSENAEQALREILAPPLHLILPAACIIRATSWPSLAK